MALGLPLIIKADLDSYKRISELDQDELLEDIEKLIRDKAGIPKKEYLEVEAAEYGI